jgi:hypothetical protein
MIFRAAAVGDGAARAAWTRFRSRTEEFGCTSHEIGNVGICCQAHVSVCSATAAVAILSRHRSNTRSVAPRRFRHA